jgi:hypothetical protein
MSWPGGTDGEEKKESALLLSSNLKDTNELSMSVTDEIQFMKELISNGKKAFLKLGQKEN